MRPDADTVGRAAVFAALGAGDRTALADCFRGRAHAPGEAAFREGDPAASLWLVGEGSFLAVVRAGGIPREVGRFGPGDIVGASSLVDRGRRRHSLIAVGPAVAYEIDADAVALLRATAPIAARALLTASLRALIHRLRRLEQRVEASLDRSGAA